MKRTTRNTVVLGLIAGCLGPAPASGAGYGTFADCVRTSGAVFYDASWCGACRRQRKDFGGYANRLKIVSCSIPGSKKLRSTCRKLGIESFPTWIFADGKRRAGLLSIRDIGKLTGCALPD
jgi:hypothetical protein